MMRTNLYVTSHKKYCKLCTDGIINLTPIEKKLSKLIKKRYFTKKCNANKSQSLLFSNLLNLFTITSNIYRQHNKKN